MISFYTAPPHEHDVEKSRTEAIARQQVTTLCRGGGLTITAAGQPAYGLNRAASHFSLVLLSDPSGSGTQLSPQFMTAVLSRALIVQTQATWQLNG